MTIRFKSGFFSAPNDIFETNELDAYEKLVYLYLCRCGHNSIAKPSIPTIARKCSMGESKVKKVLKRLESLKLITVKRRRLSNSQNLSNIYQICDPYVLTRLETIDLSYVDNKAQNDQGGLPVDVPGLPNDGKYKLTNDKKNYYKNNKYGYFISEINEVFEHYAERYREKFGEEHPTMTEDKKWKIEELYDQISFELGLEDEMWIKIVNIHFSFLPSSNNGNILSFLAWKEGQGCIRRYYDTLLNNDS